MATAEGASIPKVAEELGISDQTLRNWIKQKTTGTPLSPTNGKVDDESMKLLGLETENRRLKKEVLQLKKPPGGCRGLWLQLNSRQHQL